MSGTDPSRRAGTGGRPVVLVVGASSGIGAATALRYARDGARLALAARSADALGEVGERCRSAGAADVLVHPMDVREHQQCDGLVAAVAARYGALDVVVHSAGVTAFGRFEDIPPDVFDEVVATNLIGAANVVRAVLPTFRGRGGGSIVLVGSVLGRAPTPYQAPYSASKFGISALVRVLRQENYADSDIRFHAVYPGPVDTPIYSSAANYTGRPAHAPPPTYAPETLADAIVDVARRRHGADRSVGVGNTPLVLASWLVPAAFDAVIGPLIRLAVFGGKGIASTAGNVLGLAGGVSTER